MSDLGFLPFGNAAAFLHWECSLGHPAMQRGLLIISHYLNRNKLHFRIILCSLLQRTRDNLSVMLSRCGISSLIDKAVLKSYYEVFCLPLKQTDSQMGQTSVGHGRDPWLCLPDGKQLWFAAAVPICAASESSWRSKTALAFIWNWWSSAAQIHLKLPAETHSKWAGGLLEMWWEGSTGWMGGTASFQSTSCPTSGKGWTVPLAFPPTPKVWSARESG